MTKIEIAQEYRTDGLLMTDCKHMANLLDDINQQLYLRPSDYIKQLSNAPEILKGCRMVPWNIYCFQRDTGSNIGRFYKPYKSIAEIVGDQIIEKNKIEVSQLI